mmetsp:Transcript_27129/g.59688  ORF Transcript_27129/g.59688 Transcript_27129/m.59688 type:complete len:324 (+) Transcript_27129:57-1028(+)
MKPARQQRTKEGVPTGERHARKPTKKPSCKAPSPRVHDLGLDAETRDKVVGLLARALESGGNDLQAEHVTHHARLLEAALYEHLMRDGKEYRKRARTLAFNLSRSTPSSSTSLLTRLLDGQVTAGQVVRMQGEELLNPAEQAHREAQREKHFRTEVHLTSRLKPKRRRTLNFLQTSAEPGRKSLAPDATGQQADMTLVAAHPLAHDGEAGQPSLAPASPTLAVPIEDGSPLLNQDVVVSNDVEQVTADESQSSTSSSSSTSTSSSSQLPEVAGGTPPLPIRQTAEAVGLLTAMGFHKDAAEAALLEAKGDRVAAVEVLLGSSE